MIICAAIKVIYRDFDYQLQNLIVCGHRHGNCYEVVKHIDISQEPIVKVEGFIDHTGKFLDRHEAFTHALECGQINAHTRWYRDDSKIPNELYSEDLY